MKDGSHFGNSASLLFVVKWGGNLQIKHRDILSSGITHLPSIDNLVLTLFTVCLEIKLARDSSSGCTPRMPQNSLSPPSQETLKKNLLHWVTLNRTEIIK